MFSVVIEYEKRIDFSHSDICLINGFVKAQNESEALGTMIEEGQDSYYDWHIRQYLVSKIPKMEK